MQIRWFVLCACILSVLVLSGGCASTPSPRAPVSPAQSAGQPDPAAVSSGTLVLRVGTLSPGAVLPDEYSCKGSMQSPAVAWSGIPPGTESLVLIVDDPDAPAGTFTHWLVYNIPPRDGGLVQGQTNAKVLDNEAQQGEGSNGFRGYYPPCPPPGSTHRYYFRLYALDQYLALPTADRAAIDKAIAGHTIAGTEFVSTFSR